MASQFLRPTFVKHERTERVIQGTWGRRTFEPMSKVDLYELLHRELVESGVLGPDSPRPSNKYHGHVTNAIVRSSWIMGRWVPDEPFATRLKSLRQRRSFTQEQLAEKSGVDVGTVRQLEQGTRTNPQWQTVCALARGLNMDIVVFVGTEVAPPSESEEEKMKNEQVQKLQIIERDVIMRLEILGHFFDRKIDQERKVELKVMSVLELQALARELKTISNARDAITAIVEGICKSKAARRAEENRKFDALGLKARVSMELKS